MFFQTGISRKADGKEAEVIFDIASEFDNFVREVFDIEPPLGNFFFLFYNRIASLYKLNTRLDIG